MLHHSRRGYSGSCFHLGCETFKCAEQSGKRQKTERESWISQDGDPLRSDGDDRIPQTVFQPAAEFRKAVPADIGWCEGFCTIREAVKLPLMWKLWSHQDANRLQKTPRRPEKMAPILAGMGAA